MNKLAIFLEGETEVIFTERFIYEILGYQNVEVKKVKSYKRYVNLEFPIQNRKYLILLINSGNDEKVVSDIRDTHDRLVKIGFNRIIAIRDLYPKALQDQVKLEQGIKKSLQDLSLPCKVIVAIMEIEAWFIAEYSHFFKIDSRLTCQFIKEKFGFNPEVDNVEERKHPKGDIKSIYTSVNKTYVEGQNYETVKALDFEKFYIELACKYNSINDLKVQIENFINENF